MLRETYCVTTGPRLFEEKRSPALTTLTLRKMIFLHDCDMDMRARYSPGWRAERCYRRRCCLRVNGGQWERGEGPSARSLFSSPSIFDFGLSRYIWIWYSEHSICASPLTPMSKRMHVLSSPTNPLIYRPFSPGVSLAQQLAQLEQPAPVGWCVTTQCCANFS